MNEEIKIQKGDAHRELQTGGRLGTTYKIGGSMAALSQV
jgi:hypothetical protein